MLIKTPQGLKDVPVTEVTKDNYALPKSEEHLYHAVIEVRNFRQSDGERLSRPRIQKFGKKTFETSVKQNLLRQGFTITVLHDPNEWLRDNQQKLAERQAQQEQDAIQKKREAEESRLAQEKADKEAQELEAQRKIDETVKAALAAQQKQFEANQEEAINKAVRSALKAQQKAAGEAKTTTTPETKGTASTEEKK